MYWLLIITLVLLFVLPIVFYCIFIADSRTKRTWKNINFPKIQIQKFTDNFYVFSGTNPSDPLPRNMVVYKINNKELLLHSVIAMKEEDMKQLESIGIPKIIIVPNSFHNMDYPLYQERYKDIIVTTPSFYAKSLKNVDSSIEDWLNKNEEMKQKIIIHNPTEGQFEYLYEFRMDENSAAAVLCDQMFNLKKTGGFAGFIQYQMGSSGFFGVSFIGRMLLKCMGKTKMFKDWFSNIKEKIPCLKLICVAHGGVVSENLDDKIKIASDML